MRAFAILILVACGSSGGSDAKRSQIPPAVTALAKTAEVSPFTGWTVPGLRLYELRSHVADKSEASVVGIDDAGKLVTGPDLMRRIGKLPADDLARRAFAVLLGNAGHEPLTPKSERRFASEALWKAIEPPAITDNVLVFFAMRGEMNPELYEFRISLATYEVTFRDAASVLVARGETVALDPPRCEPFIRCNCWQGCGKFQRILDPKHASGAVLVLAGKEPPEVFVRDKCTTPPCARWCVADTPTAGCEEALRSETREACDKTCRPSEAKYHCESKGDGCEQVPHTKR